MLPRRLAGGFSRTAHREEVMQLALHLRGRDVHMIRPLGKLGDALYDLEDHREKAEAHREA